MVSPPKITKEILVTYM